MKRLSLAGVYLPVLISIFLTVACTSAPPREPAQEQKQDYDELTETSHGRTSGEVHNGPYDDCDQRELFAEHEKYGWVCTDNYVHIYPQKPIIRKKSEKLKIGAFNVYHLGDDQARLKDLDAMALIMDRWDLVGATEMMPLPTAWANENRKLREVMKQTHHAIPTNWRVMEPGYFKLLKALQKKDATWSLIFQPMPEGDGNTGEMAGFFYRASKVQPQMWDYCRRSALNDKTNPNVMGLNFGCLAQVSSEQAKLISRRAFVASFKSGNFDFIALVSHARFRPGSTSEQKQQQKELCAMYPANEVCSISKDRVGRFYEVKAVVDQFPILERFDRDLIFMGDFNLDLSPNNDLAWKASIDASPGYAIYQKENTSLSLATEKLANSYDHFILREATLKECDVNSIRAFDFTQIGSNPTDPVLKKLGYLLKPETHAKTEKEQNDFLNQQIRIVKSKGVYQARGLTAEEKERLSADVQKSIVRLKSAKFWILREYLSDHVPIEMSCNTKKDDD